jgi:putative protease
VPIEEAQNRPLTPEDLASAFSVTRNENIDAAGIEAEAGENLFLPAGRLKKTRREFWVWLEAQEEIKAAVAEGGRTENAEWKQRLRDEIAGIKERQAAAGARGKFGTGDTPAIDLPAVYTGQKKSSMPLPADYIRTEALENFSGDADEIILPFFCPESRLKDVSRLIQSAADNGIKRFRVTSLYQFELFHANDYYGINREKLILTASYPLAVPNSLAARELQLLGISRAQLWLELDKESFKAALENWPVQAEIYRKGKPFLLATRAALAVEGPITDSRGKEFLIVRNADGLNYVYPAEVLSLPAEKGCADFYDLGLVTGKHEKETGFNHDFALI